MKSLNVNPGNREKIAFTIQFFPQQAQVSAVVLGRSQASRQMRMGHAKSSMVSLMAAMGRADAALITQLLRRKRQFR